MRLDELCVFASAGVVLRREGIFAGIDRGLKKSTLLLDCVLIVTSVVPPELPMKLSLAVNASLVAFSSSVRTRPRVSASRARA